jgi:DNA-binding NarL/FixJ family response regulator
VESVEALGHRLAKSEVALLIVIPAMEDGHILEMIRKIRRNEIVGQPFMPVVALVSEPEENLVRRVIDSGADLIFTEPLSQASAEHGLKALIMHRRPFVVTYYYVGPDRRRAAREAEETIFWSKSQTPCAGGPPDFPMNRRPKKFQDRQYDAPPTSDRAIPVASGPSHRPPNG